MEEREKQLKDAAREYAVKEQNIFGNDFENFIDGAKSEAAKKYWEFSALVEAFKHGRVQELNDEVKQLKWQIESKSDNTLNAYSNWCLLNNKKFNDSNQISETITEFLNSDYYKK